MAASKRYKENLAKILLRKRTMLDISQREFARRANIPSHRTIRLLEMGDYVDYPARETLEKIANNIFKISLEDFNKLIMPTPEKLQPTLGNLLLQVEQLDSLSDCAEIIEFASRRLQQLLQKLEKDN